MVELHGGTVTAHSPGPGKGSEFVVKVPCIVAVKSGGGASPPHLETTGGNGRRLLVVDDNRDAADSLALLLGLDGHDVRVAYTGRQALEIARAARFRLPTTNRPEALPTSGWTWGRLIFEWLTRAPEPVSLSAGRSS